MRHSCRFVKNKYRTKAFLPSNDDDYTLDYSRYKFPLTNIYAFERLIEIQVGNADLAEVFSYTGQIPENPDIIIWSERMSAPEHIGHPFSENGRWRTILSNPYYNMQRDSDMKIFRFCLLQDMMKVEKLVQMA